LLPGAGIDMLAAMRSKQKLERKPSAMQIMLLALLVGIVIGVLFKSLKLPVPVPHDFAGIVGLIGIFAGSALVDVIIKIFKE
jgi:XapX domain-containing protein